MLGIIQIILLSIYNCLINLIFRDRTDFYLHRRRQEATYFGENYALLNALIDSRKVLKSC